MMDTRMLCNTKFYIPKENMVIISSEGNQDIRNQYVKEHNMSEGRDFTVAQTFIQGYLWKPIYDEKK